jgi:hypothetical protein
MKNTGNIWKSIQLLPHQNEHIKTQSFVTGRSEVAIIRALIDEDIKNTHTKLILGPKTKEDEVIPNV